MSSVEKVISGLTACMGSSCRDCPYAPAAELCQTGLFMDTLDILNRIRREDPEALMTMEDANA